MYTQEVKLQDNERLLVMNDEDGEVVREVKSSKKHNPDIINFKEDAKFIKTFPDAWQVLYTQTTPLEFKIAQRMSTMIKMMTNSLEPLDEDYSYQELADEFDISKTKAVQAFKKLFDLGVYGKFEVADINQRHTRYWVFNPYLAINGKAISKITLNLFSNTVFAKL